LYDSDGFAGILRSLHRQGCHNWNLVSPTPWIPWITDGIDTLKRDGLSLPVVYNTSGFEDATTLAHISKYVDVYLVDLRYASESTATEASSVSDYVSVSRRAVKEMWRQTGGLQFDDQGAASRGTICRLLILPGHSEEAVENLSWLRDTIGTSISVSVMSQYTPIYKAAGSKVWGRRISRQEYNTVCEAVKSMGFTQGWIQDYSSSACTELLGSNLEPLQERRKGL
jgi:putative pyruvate formate lyase activating enzyme